MIQFQGKKAALRQLLLQLAAVLSGRQADTSGIAKAFLMTIGYAALSDIRQAYVTKARGGTDAMGVKWAPLKPETIANRRVGPGDLKDKNVKSWDAARKAALKQIEKEFARQEGALYQRYLLSMDPVAAQRMARQMASRRATEKTGMTKVQALGSRQVEILRDTDVLLNSLTPGMLIGSGVSLAYVPLTSPGASEQIFNIGPGQITVGSNVPYANSHQDGNPAHGLPQRKILPEKDDEIPDDWWENWIDAGQTALSECISDYLQRGSP